MSDIACVLWWLVLGGLLGVLASWLLGRMFRQTMPQPETRVVEKVVEKVVDRPVEKLVEVEKVVEKTVPDLAALAARDAEIKALQARVAEMQAAAAASPAPAAPAAGLASVAALATLGGAAANADVPLDQDAALAAGFTVKGWDDLEVIEGIGPKIAELLRGNGIATFAQLADTPTARIQAILDEAGPQYRVANPGTWSEQADLAARNRWQALRALQDVLVAGVRVDGRALKAENESLKRRLAEFTGAQAPEQAQLFAASTAAAPAEPAIDFAAASAAGFSVRGPDNLEIVEGIGPKIANLLREAGILSFAKLAACTAAEIQPILDKAGTHFRLADPSSWPEQAGLAAHNRWADLKALQDRLTAGRR
jgi:predicted flap endonuclease-1-like 5' DNA nuclease